LLDGVRFAGHDKTHRPALSIGFGHQSPVMSTYASGCVVIGVRKVKGLDTVLQIRFPRSKTRPLFQTFRAPTLRVRNTYLGIASRKSSTTRGMRRKSSARLLQSSPTVKTPRRIANRLNTEDMPVNATEAITLAASFRVPPTQCTRNSNE